jgi:hypothetical protein
MDHNQGVIVCIGVVAINIMFFVAALHSHWFG